MTKKKLPDIEELEFDDIDELIARNDQDIEPMERECRYCATLLKQRSKESDFKFRRRKYCRQRCATDLKTKGRPEGWRKYHREARKHRKKFCESCGFEEMLHAHHIDGEIGNNKGENIQTLCTYCHNFIHATALRMGWEAPGRALPMEHILDVDEENG